MEPYGINDYEQKEFLAGFRSLGVWAAIENNVDIAAERLVTEAVEMMKVHASTRWPEILRLIRNKLFLYKHALHYTAVHSASKVQASDVIAQSIYLQQMMDRLERAAANNKT